MRSCGSGPHRSRSGSPRTGGDASVDLGDVEWVGVGLYRIDVFGPGAGECSGTFWVEVTGRSPLTTALGGGGILLVLAGAGLAASSVVRGRRHRCSHGRGAVGGIVAGVGLLLIGQQAAVLPTTPAVVGLGLVVPAALGWLLARAACAGGQFSVTPLLEAPAVVAPGARFEVTLGLALPVAAGRRRKDEVTVQLVPGTSTVVEGPLRHTLDGKDATRNIRMQATREVGAAHLTALYSVGGQTVAVARRPLWVGDAAAAPPATTSTTLPPPTPASAAALAPTPGGATTRAADLELRATYLGPHSHNVLQWTAETPHRDSITVPDLPIVVDLGDEPENFTAGLLRGVSEGEGRPGISELLLGTGRQIARTLGPEIVELISAAARATAPRLPRILVLSEEAEIPWELVAVEPSPAPGAPFLATQAIVGRWFLAPGTRSLPPPVRSGAGRRSIVASRALPGAGVEQTELVRRFGFVTVAANMTSVLDAFEHSAVVHVAAHGGWLHEEARAVLELDDGRLTSAHVAGLRLAEHPFVFLNACDVASGVDGLGTASGFPAELVFAGAGGCVLPIWAVRDELAAEFATAFYERVAAGDTPARAIRELRAAATVGAMVSATPFAYQFIGHPDLTIDATAPFPPPKESAHAQQQHP